MGIHKLLFVFIFVVIFIATGCSGGLENEEQKIDVQKRVGDENKYEDFKVVIDNEQVLKLKEILDETNWENAKVEMPCPPDYRFVFQFKNPKIEAKAVLHEVWISPNKDKLEIVQGDNQYAQLTKELLNKRVR
ncbi:hypothetical protein OKW24_001266 [Peribacillus simplex]|uniref:hypothetical protein n=1 Tax=Peribacillus simplex TaxID=1478 RepID=UPI0024E1BBA9|nr:hypothetical protein [Peribacillus simplex]MDF9759493.1 hypothetical protein [Peribacillus simplex]